MEKPPADNKDSSAQTKEAAKEILTEKSPERIKVLSVRGGFITLLSQLVRTLLLIASVVLSARYFLSPEDFGVFGVVFAVLNFLLIFKDGGLSISTIQVETLTTAQLSTLFWLNLLMGFLLTITSLIITYGIFWAYADERLLPTGIVFSMTFLFSGASIQAQALTQRQLRFTAAAVIETVSVVLAVGASLFLAWRYRHPAALASYHLVFEISQLAGFWLIAGWRPTFAWKIKESLRLVTYGGDFSFFQFLGYLRQRADKLLISWFAGIAELGFYERAYQLILVPLEHFGYPLGRIVNASLSRLQREPAHFRRHLLRWMLFSAFASMPFIAFLFGISDRLVPFVLGEQWKKAALFYQALAPAAFLMSVSGWWIYVPLGRVRRQIGWSIFSSLFFLTGFWIGVAYGAFGVAVAYSICKAAVFVPELIFTCRNTPVDWKDILRTLRHPAIASIAALVLLLLTQRIFPPLDSDFISLARDSAVYSFCYFLCWIILPNGFALLKDNFLLAWNILARKNA